MSGHGKALRWAQAGWLPVPRPVRICLAIGLIAATALLLQYGLSPWTLLAGLFLIACPAAAVWVLIVARGYSTPNIRSKK